MLLAIYAYAVVDYVFQLWGAINQAKLYKQKFPLSTLLLIISRAVGRLLGIWLFAWVFSFIPTGTFGLQLLYVLLVIVASGIASILVEVITRWTISQYVKVHAQKIINENKDEYGTGYTENMK